MDAPESRITIREVAEQAGVSLGTASRVLNGAANVAADRRQRVLAAAKRLGYRRLRARSRAPRSEPAAPPPARVGLILLGLDHSLVALPIVSAVVHGIEEAVAASGGELLIAEAPDLARVPGWLSEGRVDGLILKGPLQGRLPSAAESPVLAAAADLPHVWVLGRPLGAGGDEVGCEDVGAGRLAAEHLCAHGHRRLGFLNPKGDHVGFRRRRDGFVAGARAAGAAVTLLESVDERRWSWPLASTTTAADVLPLVERWRTMAKRPTALFVPADSVAVCVYQALDRFGRRIGRDVSLIGCNNEPALLAGLTPALTTIDVHPHAIGRNAVARLHWRLAHPVDEPPTALTVEPTLVPADSVRDLRARTERA